MTLWLRAGVVVSLLGAFAPQAARAQDAEVARGELHRFALVVGINDGGKARVPLRYAGRDAHAFADVMVQLGGVDPRDVLHVERADLSQLRVGFEAMAGRVAQARARGEHTEFLLFYSGHSDEQGLRVGEALMDYAELRKLVTSVDADVRIAVVDSCASGALTRIKGGTRRPPFLFDLSSEVRGHAFLTSASGDEAAQESDRIKASFFTHFLVSGLRGAADFNADGRVTLNEAYRFAFDETLARTERTQAGAQHPAYDIQLAGTGDLVMTDLRATDASLGVPAGLSGRLYIRDASGHLVAELSKPRGRGIELSLPPGDYSVALEGERERKEGRVTLKPAATYALSAGDLQAVAQEKTRTRGAPEGAANAATSEGAAKPAAEAEDGPPVERIPFAASLISPLDSNNSARKHGAHIENNFQVNLIWGRTDRITGAQVGLANHVGERQRGAQIGYGFNTGFGELRGAQVASGFNLHDGTSEVQAVQVAAGANLLRAPGHALQVAAGFNGAQGGLKGVQLAAVNLALAPRGLAQLGAVNLVAEGQSFGGVQFGAANISTTRLRGAQVGVFNYASRASAQVGVLSITPSVHPQLWTSNAGILMGSVRFDADYTYSLLSVGTSFSGDGGGTLGGFGIGSKTPAIAERFFIELDASGYAISVPDLAARYTPLLLQLRLMLRVQLMQHLQLFGGLALNTYFSHTERLGDGDRPGYGPIIEKVTDGDYTEQTWPGFVLGVGL
ncbi:MAG: caspase family protein [Myxococcales bacterium]|nr:caspase family protein [Myxococcales bacterium]